MSSDTESPDPAAQSMPEWVDQVADRFDAAWRHGPPPRIADFLAAEDGPRRRALVEELIKIDLECRWTAGDLRPVEDYTRELPELIGPDGSLPDELVLYASQMRSRFAPETTQDVPKPESARPLLTSAQDIRCPSCGSRIRLEVTEASEVSCSACGSAFRLDWGLGTRIQRTDLPKTLGKLQLLEELGHGSFGTVYKARDAELGRIVAVKVPRAGWFSTREEEERFLREARSAAHLHHESIVELYEVGRDGNVPYLVAEYIEGRPLADSLPKRFSFRESADLIARVAEALDYAHRNGVIHRDVSPRNILIDSLGRPHVTDFGLALRDEAEPTLTLDGQLLGAPAYMSPEQIRHPHRVDGRSDVYSLGVILYHLLTGELPFRGTARMVLHQVLQEEPRPPRRLNDKIPRDLETICLKSMAKEPGRRYATAGELSADLRRWMANEPIHARPVSAPGRLWRWSCRNPAVAGLAAALLLLVLAAVVGAAASAVYFERLAAAREEARQRSQELLSHSQATYGISLLEKGNHLGLLELVRAGETVETMPAIRESRAFSWSGWYASCEAQLLQVVGHEDHVVAAEFSPDGQLLATASADGTARLWDAGTGQPRTEPLHHPARIQAVAFSPDSRLLATASVDGTVKLWQTDTGRLHCPPLPHAVGLQGVRRMAFSREGTRLAVASESEVHFWDADGNPQGIFKQEQHRPTAVSPELGLLATLCGSATVQLWDIASGEPRGQPLQHAEVVEAVAFSPNGDMVATGSWDDTAQLWSTSTGEPRGPPLRHAEDVKAAAFSPDGRLVATGSFDGTARVWDVSTGQPVGPPLRHQGPVIGLAFSPHDGRLLATRSFGNEVRVWDVTTGQPFGQPLQHVGPITAISFHPHKLLLATASLDKTGRIWRLGRGRCEEFKLPSPERVWAVAFRPDGHVIATGSERRLVQIWDAGTGALRSRLEHPGDVVAVAYSPDGKWLATAGGIIQLWEASTEHRHGVALVPHGSARAVAFSRDGKLLAAGTEYQTGSAIGSAQIWDVDTRSPRNGVLQHQGAVYSVAFSPDGTRLATGSLDRTARVWNTASGELCRELRHEHWVEAVAYSPDGRLLATASRDQTVRLWNTAAWELHGRPLQHSGYVQALAFSPDSQLLATASADGSVRLWSVATRLQWGPTFSHDNFATAVAFSPNGAVLATASFDKTARLWCLPPSIRDLSEMKLRTWVALGARLNGQGMAEAIPWKEWQDLRERPRASGQ